jgi:hypothetical protein
MSKTKTRKANCGRVKEPSATYCRFRGTMRSRGTKSTLVVSRLDPRSVPVVEKAKALPGFRLFLSFDDGTAGEIDLASQLYGPVFEPLKDERYFAQARVNHELGTVVWPNGADFAPEFLYEQVRKQNP